MNPSPTPVLDLLRDPAKWTKHFLARNAEGKAISPVSDGAVCFCLVGACEQVYKDAVPGDVLRSRAVSNTAQLKIYDTLIQLGCIDRSEFLPSFNDSPSTTHADVIRVLEKAKV